MVEEGLQLLATISKDNCGITPGRHAILLRTDLVSHKGMPRLLEGCNTCETSHQRIPASEHSASFMQVKSRLSSWIPSAVETKDSLETSAAKAQRSASHTLSDVTEGGRTPKPAPDTWAKGALKTAQALLPSKDDIAGWQSGSGAEVSQAQSRQSTVPGVPAHVADTDNWADSAAAVASQAADVAKHGVRGAAGSRWGDAARKGWEDAADSARSGLDDVEQEVEAATQEGWLTRFNNVLTGAKHDAVRVARRQVSSRLMQRWCSP